MKNPYRAEEFTVRMVAEGSQKGAMKLHTALDYNGLLPVFVKLTDAKTYEVEVGREMNFPKGPQRGSFMGDR